MAQLNIKSTSVMKSVGNTTAQAQAMCNKVVPHM